MLARRLAPLAEQIANSLTSFLLTLVLATVLPVSQFGVVTFLVIALTFPLSVIDSVLGAAVIFDRRANCFTRAPRRLALLLGTLAALLTVYAVGLPLLLVAPSTIPAQLAPLGGAFIVLLTIAAYLMALAAFEQLRRMSYASDLPVPLLVVNGFRMSVLAVLVLVLRTDIAEPGFYGAFAIAIGVLVSGFAILALVLVRDGQLAPRLGDVDAKRQFLFRTVRVFGPNAGTTIAYAALELLFVTLLIANADAEAVARYRGLQLAMLVVNLLGAATENANAAMRMTSANPRQRYIRSVTGLAISGFLAVVGFLVLGKPLIGLLLGADMVPSTFELICGATLMGAQLLRTPFVILLKFANRFQFMLWLYIGAVVLELLIFAVLFVMGWSAYMLIGFVIAHVATSVVLAIIGWPLVRAIIK